MSGLLLLKSMLARPLVIIIPLLVSDVVETLHEWVTFIEKYVGKPLVIMMTLYLIEAFNELRVHRNLLEAT